MTRWTVPANGRHTSPYGPRNTGIPGASTFHRGHDIAPPRPGQRGVTVHAAGPGLVAAVDTNAYRGLFVRIRHDDRSMTLYQHLDDVDVRFGQRVTTGQRIGLMGSTGVGAGVHLHFECYEAGVNAYVLANAVDPVAYLARRGVRLVEASTVARPIPTGAAVPGAPGGTLPNPLTPEDVMTPYQAKQLDIVDRRTGTYLDARVSHVLARATAMGTQLASLEAQVGNLAGAVAAMGKGEPFDVEKLKAGVRASAQAGVEAGAAVVAELVLAEVAELLADSTDVNAGEVADLVLERLGAALTTTRKD